MYSAAAGGGGGRGNAAPVLVVLEAVLRGAGSRWWAHGCTVQCSHGHRGGGRRAEALPWQMGAAGGWTMKMRVVGWHLRFFVHLVVFWRGVPPGLCVVMVLEGARAGGGGMRY